jgi:hypothetical protein
MRRVSVTPAGVFLGHQVADQWPPEAYDPIIENMIRGLYFHLFGEILGDKVSIKVQWLRELNEEIRQLCTELPIAGNLSAAYSSIETEG